MLDVFSSWVYIALVLGAAVLLAARGFAGDDRRAPWLALAAGAAMWAVGELIYEIAYSDAPDLAPYPSVADAFWLGAYVAVGAGIVLVLRARLRRAFHADDVARRGDRRDDDRRADGDARVRPRARRHRRRYGSRWRPTSPIRSPTSACSRSS